MKRPTRKSHTPPRWLARRALAVVRGGADPSLTVEDKVTFAVLHDPSLTVEDKVT